ncbi:hypothetical protein [Streptomyces longisporoflavus]|uniref:Secreted protein n=1 Tax=Streptomyces longisporoflavus TaxID=28044 RepID=A0ABW7R168_9ACTN|nr:hypothetical protein [Streptomyces longisporoflavus]GGV53045.1 hypothetical protein GCM10010277_50350 [Streptomyces longisporoflavus]
MFQNVSILQQAGVAVLAVATAAWSVGLVRMLRRDRADADVRRRRPGALTALPVQSGPPRAETVELTPDERAAFAGLVRQFGDGRS